MTVTTADAVAHERGAEVLRVPPPLYFGAAFAAGMALRASSIPLAWAARPGTALAGGVVLAGGVTLTIAGIAQVARHRRTIVPHRPVSTLLTTGVYRLSRNPMYTGLAVAYLGGVLLAGSWWPLITWPAAVVAVRLLVIGPEERYLASRFGQAYSQYRSRTRRWL